MKPDQMVWRGLQVFSGFAQMSIRKARSGQRIRRLCREPDAWQSSRWIRRAGRQLVVPRFRFPGQVHFTMIRFTAMTLPLFCGGLLAFGQSAQSNQDTSFGPLLFQDSFDRVEADDRKEQVGNGWGTNSKTRAKGNKQVDLKDGVLFISRHSQADHGVSVVQDVDFRNARIEMKFKLGKQDDLGINLADIQEISVHAGHLCVAKIRLNKVEISDLKTGRMNRQTREAKLAGNQTALQKKAVAQKTRYFPVDLAADQWHKLIVQVRDDKMSVRIDGVDVGHLQSSGIAHPTKRRVRLAVGKSAAVDDLSIWGTP